MFKAVVIDDENDIVDIVKAAALRVGIECFGTTDPDEFLEYIDETTALVILDMKIPRQDGFKLLRVLKERGYQGGLLIMSGLDDRALEIAQTLALEHGFLSMGRLDKPFTPEEIDATLREYWKPASYSIPQKHSVQPISNEMLLEAMERDYLEIHFQPQIDISSNCVSGFEALVRIQHPSDGLIFPDRFIGLAEDTGLIDRLGLLVTEKAFLAMPIIIGIASKPFKMSINLSVNSLIDLNLPDRLLGLAKNHSVAPETITFEVTESGNVSDLTSLMETLSRLKLNNFNISLDDFGTGNAMMEQLQRVPSDEIKIDRQFVQRMAESYSATAVVQATIELGHRLNMKVVAEGVETQGQLDALKRYGCDIVQGYLYSKPLPLEKLVDWLKHFNLL